MTVGVDVLVSFRARGLATTVWPTPAFRCGLTGRVSYNEEKFLAYDAFLTGWALTHPRYRTLGTRPVAVFVCPDGRTALAYAQQADRVMTGRIGAMGSRPHEWYYGDRDHVLFAASPTSTTDSLAALALPSLLPAVRKQLTDSDQLELARVDVLPRSAGHAVGGSHGAAPATRAPEFRS